MYWIVNNPIAQPNFHPPPISPDDPIPKIPVVVLRKIVKIETEHSRILQQWDDTLNLLEENSNLDTQGLRGARMLKIQYISSTVIKTASLYNHDLEYDKYLSDFEQVIKLAEALINSQLTAKDKNTPLYSFEMMCHLSTTVQYNAAIRN